MTLSYLKSYELVLAARPYIHPNRGFEYQLNLLEQIGMERREEAGRQQMSKSCVRM